MANILKKVLGAVVVASALVFSGASAFAAAPPPVSQTFGSIWASTVSSGTWYGYLQTSATDPSVYSFINSLFATNPLTHVVDSTAYVSNLTAPAGNAWYSVFTRSGPGSFSYFMQTATSFTGGSVSSTPVTAVPGPEAGVGISGLLLLAGFGYVLARKKDALAA